VSEALYMSEVEQLLEELSRVACNKCLQTREQLDKTKEWTIKTLIRHYGLNPEDAENEVAAACGEEP